MKTIESTFRSVNGKNEIHVVEWIPDGPVRAVLQLAHGVAEYIERYDDFARFMAGHGIAVAGNDHLGHGKSVADPTELGWFGDDNGWNMVVEDMKKLRDQLSEMNRKIGGWQAGFDPFYGAPAVLVVLSERSGGAPVQDGRASTAFWYC